MKEKARMGLYEGMYILKASLSEELRKKALEKIKDGITEKGGIIHKTHDSMGRRKFEYKIDRQSEGYYYVLYFEVPTAAISELWKEYRHLEDLVRFITMRVETVQESLEFKPLKEQV